MAKSHIRPMTATDLDQVVEIAKSLGQAPQWPRSAYSAALAPEATPRRIALVVEDPATGVVAGFAVACLMPPEAELETIAVASAFQRRGVARQLFEKLATDLRGQQVSETLLEVRASNHQALALYRSLGFADAGRRPSYYTDPVEDALLMRLSLG